VGARSAPGSHERRSSRWGAETRALCVHYSCFQRCAASTLRTVGCRGVPWINWCGTMACSVKRLDARLNSGPAETANLNALLGMLPVVDVTVATHPIYSLDALCCAAVPRSISTVRPDTIEERPYNLAYVHVAVPRPRDPRPQDLCICSALKRSIPRYRSRMCCREIKPQAQTAQP
jgi:hypothetical protein